MYQELDFWLQMETKLDDTGEFKWFPVLEKENSYPILSLYF